MRGGGFTIKNNCFYEIIVFINKTTSVTLSVLSEFISAIAEYWFVKIKLMINTTSETFNALSELRSPKVVQIEQHSFSDGDKYNPLLQGIPVCSGQSIINSFHVPLMH